MKRKGIALLLAFLLVPSAWALTLDQARQQGRVGESPLVSRMTRRWRWLSASMKAAASSISAWRSRTISPPPRWRASPARSWLTVPAAANMCAGLMASGCRNSCFHDSAGIKKTGTQARQDR